MKMLFIYKLYDKERMIKYELDVKDDMIFILTSKTKWSLTLIFLIFSRILAEVRNQLFKWVFFFI